MVANTLNPSTHEAKASYPTSLVYISRFRPARATLNNNCKGIISSKKLKIYEYSYTNIGVFRNALSTQHQVINFTYILSNFKKLLRNRQLS